MLGAIEARMLGWLLGRGDGSLDKLGRADGSDVVGLSVVGFSVGCFVGRGVIGVIVGVAVGLFVTGLGISHSVAGSVGSSVAGTTEDDWEGAIGPLVGATVGTVVDVIMVGLEVGTTTIPAFHEKSDCPDSSSMFFVRPVEGTVKLYFSLSAN